MSKTETPEFRNTGHSVVKKLIFSQPNFTLCLLNDEKNDNLHIQKYVSL